MTDLYHIKLTLTEAIELVQRPTSQAYKDAGYEASTDSEDKGFRLLSIADCKKFSCDGSSEFYNELIATQVTPDQDHLMDGFTRERSRSIVGRPNMMRVALDRPDCCTRLKLQNQQKLIKIYFDNAFSGGYNAEDFQQLGLRIGGMVNDLLRSGYIVELCLLSLTKSSHDSSLFNLIEINLPLDCYTNKTLSLFWLSHVSVLRYNIFKIQEHAPIDMVKRMGAYSGYGYGIPLNKNAALERLNKHGLDLTNTVFLSAQDFFRGNFFGDRGVKQTAQEASLYLENELLKHGIRLNDQLAA